MQQWRDHEFVVHDTLQLFDQKAAGIYLAGEIACLGNIIVDVMKRLEVVPGPGGAGVWVQTVVYAYHVNVRGAGPIFRYDNQHPDHLHEGHKDEHHKHEFDWPNPEEKDGSPIWTGASGWPYLSEVLDEARNWWCDHCSDIDPNAYVPLEQLRRGLRI
jgi:Family of unknown function (DUF6516)